MTIRQLTVYSGYSRATIQRILRYWLSRPPEMRITNSASKYLVCDGTFLHGRKGMYAAMDGLTHRILYAGYGVNEGPRHLLEFCRFLKDSGVYPQSVTIDGNPHIFRAVQIVWPQASAQRCLVHIHRQGLSWCRHHPKRPDAKQLRNVFLMVLQIHSYYQRRQFLKTFERWEQRYGYLLAQTGDHGWVTSDLQRARSMLANAIPFMFTYLRDHNIPWSTNALEGYFSRLKQRYRQHRGLSRAHRANYFQWYFHLCQR